MINLGRVRPGSTIYIPFETFANSTGAPITLTGLATSDIQVYKDGGTTQRASASGFTLLDTDGIDFDGITGIHGFSIDLSDNTTADFWASGSRYFVVVSTVTVDSQTMSFIAATFEVGYQGSWLDTTIATLASQTSFTLTSGPAEDDALNGHWAIIHDAASAVQSSRVLISDYTGASKTVTLAAGATFTAAAKDNISIMGMAPMQPATIGRQPVVDSSGLVDANTVKVGPTGSGTAQTARDIGASVLLSSGTGTGQLDFTSGVVKSDVSKWLGTAASTPTVAGVPNVNVKTWNDLTTVALPLVPTTAGRTLDVSVGGEAGVDWANVGSPTTVVGLSGTTVKTATDVETDTADIQSRLPAALTAGGNIKADALAINAVATTSVTNVYAHIGTSAASTAQTGDSYARLGAPAGASVSADIATVDTNVDTLVSRITSTLFSGITSLAEWLGLIAGKQTGNATARTEIRATGAGSGTFDETTDSVQAIRDRGDAAWTTATGFSTLDAAGVRTAVGLASANLDTQLAALPTATENADQVWEEAIADHVATVGSTAEALNAAGSAGDPWNTALPGAYASGKAGYILGNIITNIPPAVWAEVLETGFDASRLLRCIAAATAGKNTGEPGSPVFRNLADTQDQITGTADTDGNRSSITYGS